MVNLNLPADGSLNWGPPVRDAFNALNNGKVETAELDTDVAELMVDSGSTTSVALQQAINSTLASSTLQSDSVVSDIELAGAYVASGYLGPIYRTAWTTTPGEVGYVPDAQGHYTELWTRDNTYTMWHMPQVFLPSYIADFVRYRLANRSTASTPDPDGGTLGTAGANFVADKISQTGVVTFKYAARSKLPFMDGIAFVVLATYTHYKMVGNNSLFTEVQNLLDICLAAIPRSANGCVYSDPAAPSVDYGFTDGVLKTGDVTYGTALQAWAYKMMAEMAGENGDGPYTLKRVEAQNGLSTLRKSSGWYMGSSLNNAAIDDVWATALIVAENLCSASEADISAATIRDAFLAGTITQRGWIRHMPVGQYWVNCMNAPDSFQNGGYWLTPLWDCYRAVLRIDRSTADSWATQAIAEVLRQYSVQGTIGVRTAPYEWFFGSSPSASKGYTASAAIVNRFSSKPSAVYQIQSGTTQSTRLDMTVDPGWTIGGGMSYDGVNDIYTSSGADGGFALKAGTATSQGIAADVTFTRSPGPILPGLFIRYVDANNNIWVAIGGATNTSLDIYQKVNGTTTTLASQALGVSLTPGVRYRMVVSSSGNLIRARLNGVIVAGTATLTTAGQLGVRHGSAGAGTSTFKNIIYSTVDTTISGAVTASTALPSDVFVVHEGGFLASTDRIDGPLIGDYKVIAPSGKPLATGRVGAGLVTFSGAMG